ncbi:MAG TPA: enoyl-CoA hydratase [Alphaproteobacteria bacterium]|nr:enoyl-CoA hydratase [Alphaproteobacteria bacterium]
MPEFREILYSVEDHILTITFNRPDALNAMTNTLYREFMTALDLAEADDEIRAIIVTGAGRAFCAGAALGGTDDETCFIPDAYSGNGGRIDGRGIDWRDWATRDRGGMLTLRLFECVKPLIAAANGPGVGVGATMQLAMDIRLASEQARFGFVFARRGIVPEGASSWFLPRIVGISRALEWCYSGRMVKADEALDAGLVRAVYPQDELLPAARAIATEIAENAAPVSVALTRQMMWKNLGAGHPMNAHQLECQAIAFARRSADAREGVTAFLKKRRPDFPLKVSRDMPQLFKWWQGRKFR